MFVSLSQGRFLNVAEVVKAHVSNTVLHVECRDGIKLETNDPTDKLIILFAMQECTAGKLNPARYYPNIMKLFGWVIVEGETAECPLWVKAGDSPSYHTPISFPALLERGLSRTQAAILHFLLMTESHDPKESGWIDVRQEAIAKAIGKPEKYVQMVIRTLEICGLIERKRVGAPGGRTKTIYKIKAQNWDKCQPSGIEEEDDTSDPHIPRVKDPRAPSDGVQ